MQIFHINSLTDLKKHNKRFKFDSGGFHCIYFGSTSNTNFDYFKKLKLNVLFTDDIYIDKVKFKSDYVQFIGNLSTCFTSKMWWATQTAAKFRNQIPFILYKLKIVSEILNKYSFEKLIVIDESYLFNRAIYFFSKNKSIELEKLREVMINSCMVAGAELNKLFISRHFSSTLKKKNELVTDADIISENILIESISNYNFNIISEECGKIDNDSDYTFIIDPLCGTVNFANNIGHSAISIALQYNSQIIVGVVYDFIKNIDAIERMKKFRLKSDRADVIEPATRIFVNLFKEQKIQKIYLKFSKNI